MSISAAPLYPDETGVSVWEALDGLRLGTVFYVLAFVAVGLYRVALQRCDTGWGMDLVRDCCRWHPQKVIGGTGIPAYWKTDHTETDP